MSTDPRFQSTDPRFSADYTPEEPKKRSAWQTCLIGCLVVLAILLVVGILVGVWLVRNGPGLVANAATAVVDQLLDASDLPQQEKQEVHDQVARLRTAFDDGKLPWNKLGQIVDRIMNSPLMPAIMVFAVEKQYFDHSGLSADEKFQGKQTLRRFLRGLSDKTIDEQGMDSVLSHIGTKGANGQWEMKQQVTDDELRAALAEAKSLADQANIPDVPADFDPSDEIKKVIDEEIGPEPVEAVAPAG